MPEFWTLSMPIPGQIGNIARRTEATGWDGLVVGDSQNLAGETWVGMGIAARETTRLKLGTGVTNPVTRHAAVTASAIAMVQVESGGRASLGIGRGDSSLAHIGESPSTPTDLEEYCKIVQVLLSGNEVNIKGKPSRLVWLRDHDVPKVPLEIVGTGPRVLGVAARVADRMTVNMGVEPDRVGAAVQQAREHRTSVGLSPDGLAIGAYVIASVHDDVDRARELVRGAVATFAHFSVMGGGRATADLNPKDASIIREVDRKYDYNRHSMSNSAQATAIDHEFIDRFAAVGPPERCVERLAPLIKAGVDRIVVLAGSRDGDPAERAASADRFAQEVIPALRSM